MSHNITIKNQGKFLQALKEKRMDILEVLSNFPAGGNQTKIANPDQVDLATEFVTREQQAIFLDEIETQLDQIETALQRIDDGSFGLCASCGEQISEARLEVLPYTPFCMECQQKRERFQETLG